MAEKKKLIEVALPLEAINAASVREKSIRHGHPSTLHLWWARRPLAAARAVIWSSLVDDPSSHPEEFPTEEDQERERQRLFRILEDLVIWENSNDERVLAAAKAEIMKSTDGNPPALLDPFAGGGAIPLEAQRLGLEAHASDLNPVAVMINKAMIEIPPKFAGCNPVNPEARKTQALSSWTGAQGLAEDVRYYGEWMKQEAFKKIGHLYPKVKVPAEQGGGEATVIAWIWARTVKCPNPACGCELPLIKSTMLSKTHHKYVSVHYSNNGKCSFKVTDDKPDYKETVSRKGVTCPHCGSPVSFQYVRSEGMKGRISERIIAIVAEGSNGRIYLSPSMGDEVIAMIGVEVCNLGNLSIYPGYINPPAYGYKTIESLYSNRQLNMLNLFSSLIEIVGDVIQKDSSFSDLPEDDRGLSDGGKGAVAYSQAIRVYLALAFDKMADYSSTICSWNPARDGMSHTFSMTGISMSWDYAEANPFSHSSGCFTNMLNWIKEYLSALSSEGKAFAEQHDAQSNNDYCNIMISTDPPYYSNVPYADFSDFFYVWLRCNISDVYPDLFLTLLTPKVEELVADPFRDNRGKLGARTFFEDGMSRACRQIYNYSREDIPVTIYYASKQNDIETGNSEGAIASTAWETMLAAIINSGFCIVGTWPIRTERSSRTRGYSSNALASSIVLVCRKRPKDALVCTRRDFVKALRRELKPALKHLQESNIAPVDLAQSAIGPGMGVYSRYSKVIEADGSVMDVRSALQIINQELDLYFTEQEGDLDRESRFCVELYTQYAFNDMKFGDADVLARAKNTSVAKMADDGALYAQRGIVHLMTREDLSDKECAVSSMLWVFTQRLVRAMEIGGVESCAQMLQGAFGASKGERAKSLAYRLFTIADKKGWAQEAYAYNNLVISWPEISIRAAEIRRTAPVQTSMFDTTSD